MNVVRANVPSLSQPPTPPVQDAWRSFKDYYIANPQYLAGTPGSYDLEFDAKHAAPIDGSAEFLRSRSLAPILDYPRVKNTWCIYGSLIAAEVPNSKALLAHSLCLLRRQ